MTTDLTYYSNLIFEFASIDGNVCEAERTTIEEWLADHPHPESFRSKSIDAMSEVQVKLLLEDLAFLSACDGEVSAGEAGFIQQIARESGIDDFWAVQLLSGARSLADEIRARPREIVHEINTELSEQESPTEALALAMVGASAGALALGAARELAERAVKNKAQGYVLEGVAEELSDVGVSFPLEFLESCVLELPAVGTAKIPVVGAAMAVKKAASGDLVGAATQSATSAGSMLGGAAAGAAAASFAYAGFSGALLKGAVVLGLASPPTAVVVAPILGGAAGAVAVGRALKWYQKRE